MRHRFGLVIGLVMLLTLSVPAHAGPSSGATLVYFGGPYVLPDGQSTAFMYTLRGAPGDTVRIWTKPETVINVVDGITNDMVRLWMTDDMMRLLIMLDMVANINGDGITWQRSDTLDITIATSGAHLVSIVWQGVQPGEDVRWDTGPDTEADRVMGAAPITTYAVPVMWLYLPLVGGRN